ncbi:MAG: HEPN domain-containing protein [Thermodesulfovibrionales bacterium]|nr:HEPN domain-containing protein [Thermodesulfovibrionales bacterium]
MAKNELAEAEVYLAVEKLSSFKDDYKAERWGNATVNLFFALEHIVKALLAGVGMESKSHEGVRVLFSMHFIKAGLIHPKIGRYLGNLYDRRVSAEYSPLRRAEFVKEEVDIYYEWVKEALVEILPLLKENGIDTTSLEDFK